MGKVNENKQQKLDALLSSAYDLFLTQGIEKTSIHDIVKNAGVAKGTFYLYFKDKYEIRDRLIEKTARQLFETAHRELLNQEIPVFEDRVIFIIDYIVEELRREPDVLRFVSKNLSWGIFRQALSQNITDVQTTIKEFYDILLSENPSITLRAPETMLFLIIELTSSASFSTILENDPMSFDELKPDLYKSIRAIVRNHIVT